MIAEAEKEFPEMITDFGVPGMDDKCRAVQFGGVFFLPESVENAREPVEGFQMAAVGFEYEVIALLGRFKAAGLGEKFRQLERNIGVGPSQKERGPARLDRGKRFARLFLLPGRLAKGNNLRLTACSCRRRSSSERQRVSGKRGSGRGSSSGRGVNAFRSSGIDSSASMRSSSSSVGSKSKNVCPFESHRDSPSS